MPNVSNTDEITQQVNSGNTNGDATQNNQNQQQNNSSSKQVVLGCDDNGNDDSNYQNTVKGVIEQAGYQVEALAIEPNAYASYSYDSKAKGKIGIYLIAAGTYSIGDAYEGGTSFDYNYFGIRPECSPNWDVSDFDTKPIGSDPDTRGGVTDKIAGKSFKEINEIVKDRCMCVTGKDATEMGNNLVAAMGGQATGGSAATGGGAVLMPDKTFFGLIQQMMGAVDAAFIIANNMAYLLSFKDIYEYRNQFDELIPKIERKDVLKDSTVKNWSTDGFYNAVEVTYADGTVKYQNDNLVKQHGENVFYYDFPEDDEETAKAKADALLSAHIRDYSTSVELSVFYNEQITEGSWVKVHKTITQISGKTRKEIQQDELKKKNKKAVSSKHKGITIENIVEKTIKGDDGKEKKIQSIKDAEGEKFDIEIEESEYELFFVQGYTCRWDKDNAALIMDLHLKYGPDTPQDPINATIGTGGSGGGTSGTALSGNLGQLVAQWIKGATTDLQKAQNIHNGLMQYGIIYDYYCNFKYNTPDECLAHCQSPGLNCGDTAHLTMAAMKQGGLNSHIELRCDTGHFFCVIEIGGQKYYSDLTANSGQKSQRPWNEVWEGDTCGNPYSNIQAGDGSC